VSKTVLITGAGIGIGRATAKAFAKAGYTVVATDVLEREGVSVADEIVRGGGKAEFHKLDVRSTEAADAVVAAAEKKYGGVDAIVANAGIAHRVPLAKLDDEKWDHTFEIDLKGIYRVVRPAVAGMRARKTGAIVCLSSIMGVAYGWDEHVHYSSAKAGVVGLVRGLAVELAKDGVRVNGVAPVTSAPRNSSAKSTRSDPRAPKRRAPSFPWAGLANPKRSRTSLCFWRQRAPAT
jgi:3-oxoacyl-[acyl-carrier protein] reductase